MTDAPRDLSIGARIDEYVAQKEERCGFVHRLEDFISRLLTEAGIEVYRVKGRVKSAHSYARHLIASPSTATLQDLTGIRVIVLYPPDVQRAVDALKDGFGDSTDVFKGESNRVRVLHPWEFAYRSHHLKFRPIRLNLPGGVPEAVRSEWFEIQVRTMAEDLWGTVDHRLRYKAPFPLSSDEKRILFRTAALLESVDHELVALMEELGDRATRTGLEVRAGKYTAEVSPAGVRALVFDEPDVALALCKATAHGWKLLSRDGHEYEAGGNPGSPAETSEAESCALLAKTMKACGANSMRDAKDLAVKALGDEQAVAALAREGRGRGLSTKSFPADLISLILHATQNCPTAELFESWQPALDAVRELPREPRQEGHG